jgi:hypothetical protein
MSFTTIKCWQAVSSIIEIDGSGLYRLINIDLSDNEMYFEKSNLQIGYKPWIFYSWQGDYNTSRSHIKDENNAVTKAYPNPNVIFELSLSFQRKKPNQIIMVKQNRQGDFSNHDDVPFDISHNRFVKYDDPPKLKEDIKENLISALKNIGIIEQIS